MSPFSSVSAVKEKFPFVKVYVRFRKFPALFVSASCIWMMSFGLLGSNVGFGVGLAVGVAVGGAVGIAVGRALGSVLGSAVGSAGRRVGVGVTGALLGAGTAVTSVSTRMLPPAALFV